MTTDSPSETNFQKSINDAHRQVSDVVRQRRTVKLLGNVEQPLWPDPGITREFDQVVKQAISDAGLAPFHFDRKVDGIAEPWRTYILWHDSCRQLAADFSNVFGDIKPGNRIPAMLSGCGAVVIVNWLPETDQSIVDSQKRESVNHEHLLAVGAYIQNLLLICEAAGCTTYWSSGGQLGSNTFFERVAIPNGEKIAGAIYIGYPEQQATTLERLGGGQHQRRSPSDRWCRELIWV
jgi:nitroreductase